MHLTISCAGIVRRFTVVSLRPPEISGAERYGDSRIFVVSSGQ